MYPYINIYRNKPYFMYTASRTGVHLDLPTDHTRNPATDTAFLKLWSD